MNNEESQGECKRLVFVRIKANQLFTILNKGEEAKQEVRRKHSLEVETSRCSNSDSSAVDEKNEVINKDS